MVFCDIDTSEGDLCTYIDGPYGPRGVTLLINYIDILEFCFHMGEREKYWTVSALQFAKGPASTSVVPLEEGEFM
jgi:hypothetical protein